MTLMTYRVKMVNQKKVMGNSGQMAENVKQIAGRISEYLKTVKWEGMGEQGCG